MLHTLQLPHHVPTLSNLPCCATAQVLRVRLQELLRPHVAASLEPFQVNRVSAVADLAAGLHCLLLAVPCNGHGAATAVQSSKAETGGSLCVKAADGSDVSHILIIKVGLQRELRMGLNDSQQQPLMRSTACCSFVALIAVSTTLHLQQNQPAPSAMLSMHR